MNYFDSGEVPLDTRITKSINVAVNNRMKCSYCCRMIAKGQKCFREQKTGYNHSHTINICKICAVVMFVKFEIDENEVKTIQKEMILNNLEDE
jgi:hypothetical protein